MTDGATNISAHSFQTGATVAPGGSLVLDHPSELPFKGGERVMVVITPSPADEEAIDAPSAAGEKTFDTRTPHERAEAFRAWAESHRRDTPLLSDFAVSRESMYGERG